jgi:hypothetical protein
MNNFLFFISLICFALFSSSCSNNDETLVVTSRTITDFERPIRICNPVKLELKNTSDKPQHVKIDIRSNNVCLHWEGSDELSENCYQHLETESRLIKPGEYFTEYLRVHNRSDWQRNATVAVYANNKLVISFKYRIRTKDNVYYLDE